MNDVYWLSCETANPPRSFSQDEVFRFATYDRFPDVQRRKISLLFKAAHVDRRFIWLSDEDLKIKTDPDDFHRRYLSGVRSIAFEAAEKALKSSGLQGADIDFLVFVSCTGYTCPGFSTELAYRLGVPENRPTANLLGMGCSAWVPGIERAYDRLRSHPGSRALVISAEICSATYWIDEELETAVGNSFFADGAAAAILSSNPADLEKMDRSSPVARIESFRTLRDGNYLDDMGFTQANGRLRVRLAREIPDRILPLVSRMIQALELPEGARLAIHPGGRKILDDLEIHSAEAGWNLKDPLKWSRGVLRNFGNMSSCTAGFVLKRSFEEKPWSGSPEVGALLVMGPGLSVEAMKMTWESRRVG